MRQGTSVKLSWILRRCLPAAALLVPLLLATSTPAGAQGRRGASPSFFRAPMRGMAFYGPRHRTPVVQWRRRTPAPSRTVQPLNARRSQYFVIPQQVEGVFWSGGPVAPAAVQPLGRAAREADQYRGYGSQAARGWDDSRIPAGGQRR
jgi:hypothetical protein